MRPILTSLLTLASLLGCAGETAAASDSGGPSAGSTPADPVQEGAVLLEGARLPGASAPTRVLLVDGAIAALDPAEIPEGAEIVDLSGRWLAPAFIDSHVHLAYLPQGAELLQRGVAGAVDLAAPVESIASDQGALRVAWSGPMITAVDGYPTQGWGRNGYGLEVSGADEAAAGVESLVGQGAQVIKVPVESSAGLSPEELEAVVEAAHGHGLKVAAHAMTDEQAGSAADAGVDVLAHTPTGSLSEATLAAWSDRAVVSTLAAFGASSTTKDNLRSLHSAGATVLYGTDFGNTRDAGIQLSELRLLEEVGLSGEEILASGTSVPAAWWGIEDLGSIEVGKAGSLLVLASDPHEEPTTLAEPVEVWVNGVRQ